MLLSTIKYDCDLKVLTCLCEIKKSLLENYQTSNPRSVPLLSEIMCIVHWSPIAEGHSVLQS